MSFSVLAQLTSTFDQAARTAGLNPTGWLTAHEIAAVVRTAYDPKALAALDRWSSSGRPEADPAAAGPVVVVEKADHIATDSAVHATYWVENWPRIETSARASCTSSCSPPGCGGPCRCPTSRRAWTPRCATSSARRRRVIADAAERARRGQVDSEADSIEYQDIKARERQLIAGPRGCRPDRPADRLGRLRGGAAVRVRGRGDRGGRRAARPARPLTWQQAEAFTAAAMPLALAA